MSASGSSSTNPFPQYRVRRKPAPVIDIAEKYPSPDPQDPFAPLWVLRNRTSSALGQNPLAAAQDTPSSHSKPPTRAHHGPPTGKSDTLNSAFKSIPVERRRSNSYLSPHSTTTTTYGMPPRSGSTLPQSSNNAPRIVPGLDRLPSQSAPTTTVGSVSHPPTKPAHPNVNSDSTQRSNATLHTDKHRNAPQLVHPQPRAPGNIARRLTVDRRTPDNSSGNETESDLSIPKPAPAPRKKWVDVKVKSIDVESQAKTNNAGLTTTISFNVGVDVKPALLRRVASNGTTSTGSASLARSGPAAQQPMSQQSRLAKFLLPKKTSHDGYTADGEKKSINWLNQKGPVHKLSISAPLTDTFVHEQGRSKSQQSKEDDNTTSSSARHPGRFRGGNTSDTDFEEGTGGVRLRRVLFKARKKATEDTPVSNATPEGADVDVLKAAVVGPKPGHPDDKETERRRPEMSWAEVNLDEYYTPVTSPRASYPTPAPSPQLRPALELEAEGPSEEQKVKGGKPKKGSNDSEAQEKETKSTDDDSKPEVKASVSEAMSSDANPVKVPAPRARKLKASVPLPSPPIPPSSSASITSSAKNPPPPPPKLFKRRTSSSTPAQTVAEGLSVASSPNDRAQLPNTHSISNTSIVHVSLPKPGESLPNEDVDAGAFVKPRRAPRPPAAVGGAEGVQSEPEPLTRERFDTGSREDRKQLRKRDGGETLKTHAKSDDEVQAPKRQNLDAAVNEMKDLEADPKSSSRLPISVVKHGKAASADFVTRKNKAILVGVGRAENSGDGASKKATMPVSMSTPACLSSKEKEGGSLLQSQPQVPRPIFNPKGVSPDNSFNFSGVPSTEYNLPPRTQLSQAASLPVYGEDGRKHSFGSLFEKQKTVVIFIRHFWCPLCQDYMSVVKSTIRPDMIVPDGWTRAGAEKDEDEVVWKFEKRGGGNTIPEVEKIGFVVISNGAHGMIAKYRQIFSLPFRVYTDPSLAIYKLLGMGKTGPDCQHDPQHGHPTQYLSDAPAPSIPKKKHSYSLRKKADTSLSSLSDREQGGGYVKHGLMGGIAMVVVRAIKVGMPVWEKGGDVGQLGGEFVLGPGLICTYAHKMQSSKGHAPIEEVLQAAGVKLGTSPELPSSPSWPDPLPSTTKQELAQKQTDIVDLSSPPKPLKETRHAQDPVRNRKESLKGMQETGFPSKSIITNPTAIKSTSHPRVLAQRGERERRKDQSSSSPVPTSVPSHKIVPPALPPALKAVMTREEETRWAEERQKSIERAIQDRGNNVRRVGALGRSPSSQGQSASASGGYVVQPVKAKEGRGIALTTELRSGPAGSVEDEEKIVYKAEGRRVQERTRGYNGHGSGSGHMQRVSVSRAGTSATTTSNRR